MTTQKGFKATEVASGAAGDVVALQNACADPGLHALRLQHTSGNDTAAQSIATRLGGTWTGTRVGAALDHAAFGQVSVNELQPDHMRTKGDGY